MQNSDVIYLHLANVVCRPPYLTVLFFNLILVHLAVTEACHCIIHSRDSVICQEKLRETVKFSTISVLFSYSVHDVVFVEVGYSTKKIDIIFTFLSQMPVTL